MGTEMHFKYIRELLVGVKRQMEWKTRLFPPEK
jgi:hypothetical protein